MQITVFFIVYTKKSTMLSLWVLIIRSVRVVIIKFGEEKAKEISVL